MSNHSLSPILQTINNWRWGSLGIVRTVCIVPSCLHPRDVSCIFHPQAATSLIPRLWHGLGTRLVCTFSCRGKPGNEAVQIVGWDHAAWVCNLKGITYACTTCIIPLLHYILSLIIIQIACYTSVPVIQL